MATGLDSGGNPIHVKMYSQRCDAETERENIEVMSHYLERHPSDFRVPEVLDGVGQVENAFFLMMRRIEGENGLSLLRSGGWDRGQMTRAIRATAAIHVVLGRHHSSKSRTHTPQSDLLKVRLDGVLAAEVFPYLSPSDRDRLTVAGGALCDLMASLLPDPCLFFYKDSNPSNWIAEPALKRLWAMDFEGARAAPAVFDLVNITEFPGVGTELTLLDAYRLYEDALAEMPDYTGACRQASLSEAAIHCCAAYRHQEQIAHRLRDLQRGLDRDKQISDLDYHLRQLAVHASNLPLDRQLDETIAVYQSLRTALRSRPPQKRITHEKQAAHPGP